MAQVAYPCYIERKDNRGQWYWIYYASNGEEIGRSSESYVNKSACDRSIAIMKASGNSPEFYYD